MATSSQNESGISKIAGMTPAKNRTLVSESMRVATRTRSRRCDLPASIFGKAGGQKRLAAHSHNVASTEHDDPGRRGGGHRPRAKARKQASPNSAKRPRREEGVEDEDRADGGENAGENSPADSWKNKI